MPNKLRHTVQLPSNFRVEDVLKFHRRDAQEVSECVTQIKTIDVIEKGILWNGAPALLSLHFPKMGPSMVVAFLTSDDVVTAGDSEHFQNLVHHMLGLNQNIQAFEQQYSKHPQIGKLIQTQAGLRVPVAAAPFEALAWAIAGQQISVSAALSLRRKLIMATNIQHTSGRLLCHPTAIEVAALSLETLRQAGFSVAKAQTLLTLSKQVVNDELPLDDWLEHFSMDNRCNAQTSIIVQEMCAKLQSIKGIGPWTINYTLLRGYGWLGGSLHGDVAVRRALQILLEHDEKISANETQQWLAEFSPHQALVAAHLWNSLSIIA